MTISNAGKKNLNSQLLDQLLFWGIPLAIAFSYLILVFQADLRLSIATLIGSSALIMVLLAIALYFGEARGIGWSSRTIILTAIAFRLIFLFRLPELSDDIYRYLWDGLMVLNGNNPYAFAPSDAEHLSTDFAALLGHVNHPQLVTIYPPAAQIFFAVGAFVGGISGMKVVLIVADIIVCAVMLRILSRMNLPLSRAVLYAWHPLPILEIASSGHIDAAGILLMMLAFMLLLSPSESLKLDAPDNRWAPVAAGIAFSAAMLVKLFPLVLFPAFLFLAGSKRRMLFLLGAGTGTAVLAVPFFPDLYNMFTTLDIYVHNWEFAGFAFQSLHGIFPSGSAARQILAVVFFVVTATLYLSLFRKRGWPKGGDNQSRFLEVFKTVYYIVLAFLLLTPTLHPWYALYLVCLLPFVAGTAGLVMSWAVLLSYRVLINFTLFGKWEENDAVPAIIWAATVGALVLSWLFGRWKPNFFRACVHHKVNVAVR